jgi:hypothetical protein
MWHGESVELDVRFPALQLGCADKVYEAEATARETEAELVASRQQCAQLEGAVKAKEREVSVDGSRGQAEGGRSDDSWACHNGAVSGEPGDREMTESSRGDDWMDHDAINWM